jgi:hypothetical protein
VPPAGGSQGTGQDLANGAAVPLHLTFKPVDAPTRAVAVNLAAAT